MMLTGTFSRIVDDKLRIAIPKSLRDCFSSTQGGAIYVAPGTDGSLSLYSEEAFAALAGRLAQTSPTARETRDYGRLFYAQATRVEIDSQGRVRIPQELADLVDLGREVVLLGVYDHLELWDRRRWQSYLEEKQARYDEIAEAAFGGSMAVENEEPSLDPVPRAPR